MLLWLDKRLQADSLTSGGEDRLFSAQVTSSSPELLAQGRPIVIKCLPSLQ